jgi:hypothetical protein
MRTAALALLVLSFGAPRAWSDDDTPTPTWRVLQAIADAKGFRKEFDAVPAHLAAMTKAYGGIVEETRFTRVARGLSHPWIVPELAREVRDGFAASVGLGGSGVSMGKVDLAAAIVHAAKLADVELGPESADPTFFALDELWKRIAPPPPGTKPTDAAALATLEGDDLLAKLSEYVGGCHRTLEALTERMSDAQKAALRRDFPAFCEFWKDCNRPKADLSEERFKVFDDYKGLVHRVDRALLDGVALRVARLAEPNFLTSLGRRLAKTTRPSGPLDGFSGDLAGIAGDSDVNRVVLLGTGKSTVSGRAALVVDLGGDDTWQRAAVADDASELVSVVLELGGNDVYAAGDRALAYACGGVALLVDAKGKDSYTCGRCGEAASSCGFAALVDLDGDDKYVAQDYAQGFTFCGRALLIDRVGNDTYDAWAFAQGGGIGNGVSACVDGGGNDRYVGNGQWPDVYGDSGPGSFQGLSQGYNTGIRGLRSDGKSEVELAGGTATLIDAGDGKDYYESGNFSQGGGYFFGFGLMFDGGGDDENHGYRYSQGFGVHQAIGVRWDAGGNDRYSTKCAANCGAAWDEGVGWFQEDGGNDVYEVGGIALGGAAQTAVAVMVDASGDDQYGGPGGNDAQGGTDGHEYHEKEGIPQSIGALLDLGGGKDVYSRKDRGDERALSGDLYGIFVDAKEKSAEKLLEPKVLEKLLAPPVAKPEKKPTKNGDKKQ